MAATRFDCISRHLLLQQRIYCSLSWIVLWYAETITILVSSTFRLASDFRTLFNLVLLIKCRSSMLCFHVMCIIYSFRGRLWRWVSVSSHIISNIHQRVCTFFSLFRVRVCCSLLSDFIRLLDAGYGQRITIYTNTSRAADSTNEWNEICDRYCLKCVLNLHIDLISSSIIKSADSRFLHISCSLRFLAMCVVRLGFYKRKIKSIPLWLSVFSFFFPFRCWYNDSLYSKSPAFCSICLRMCCFLFVFVFSFLKPFYSDFFFCSCLSFRFLRSHTCKARVARPSGLPKFYCGHSILFSIGELESNFILVRFSLFNIRHSYAAVTVIVEYISHLTISINLNRWVYCIMCIRFNMCYSMCMIFFRCVCVCFSLLLGTTKEEICLSRFGSLCLLRFFV